MEGEIFRVDTTKFTISSPVYSEWQCKCFGTGDQGLAYRPLKGQEPNWFWRKMQYLILGNKWVKDKS